MMRYNPSEIEPKWQQIWADDKRYEARQDSGKPKYYVTGMFPYPSGAGMHVGHFMEHSIVDAVARFQRAHGREVMYPMGWDAFGLPAENYAIKTGIAPSESTKTNIASFTDQLQRVGASIDWSREINTSEPEYYKWTQWIFTQLYERGLAYQKQANQWWCPVDKTVLANEQVEAGKCWRCGTEVVKKSMKQWFFKITDYADALLEQIPALDWPEKIKTAQVNWIGRSEGAEIDFVIDNLDEQLTVFTTRPDTIFGATFMVIAPEHPLIARLVNDDTRSAVDDYVQAALKRSEIERQSEGKDKTGVFTGSYAINPANGEKIPIWVADYVLWGYGTGAIMAVPAHDERDYEFATKFKLPVIQVVAEFYLNEGAFVPRSELETIEKVCVDAIITDGRGNYLLQTENEENVHFVGGGVDSSDTSHEAALRREVREETGYIDITDIKPAAPWRGFEAYRHTKNKNMRAVTQYYEVVVDPDSTRVKSEVDDGKHSLEWVPKDEVKDKITWKSHRVSWQYYLDDVKVDRSIREGVLVNSGAFNNTLTSDAREQIVAWLEQQGVGRSKVTYKMRDWLVSRQRYWGAPIPIVHCDEHGAVAVDVNDLPIMLPPVDDYEPKGESVLASQTDWVEATCPKCGGPAKRETDTMDGYACSSWYLLRYADPDNSTKAWDTEKVAHWTPLDMYVGGDHAVAHLLYVRFWNHVFYDMGLVPTKEPVKKLVYHGYINAEDGTKMSKSKGNVVDPLEVIDAGYGADALRTFELFLGPINENSNWSSSGIAGVYRFLNRAWTITQEFIAADASPASDDRNLLAAQHRTTKKVTVDIHRLNFNTAIAGLMEYVNDLYKLKVDGFDKGNWRMAITTLVQLLGPFAPHMSAELWQQLGYREALDFADWPTWDDSLTVAETMTIVVQVNGKVRAKLELAKDASEADIKATALAEDNVVKFVGDKKPAKVIYVPGRLVNVVA